MSDKSNNLGRAFEYACIEVLEKRIAEHRTVKVDKTSVMAAYNAWQAVEQEQQDSFITAANAFIDTLFQAEPLILEYDSENDIIELSINKDSDAEQGDVRDIVIKRGEIQWEIGLSMKHNHFAAKHSRLSPSIDFGEKWYGTPCDQSYWKNVKPIFDNLKEVTYSPAYASLRGGGFSLKYSNLYSINELSPCVPRFLFLFYANAILIPSFRMFTAAFISLL